MTKPKKYIVYVLDTIDESGIVFTKLSGITSWIKGEDWENMKDEDLEDYEYRITVKRMTKKEINNLPELD